MKKTIIAVLCAVLLASVCAFPVFASSVPHFFLKGPSSVNAGDELEIIVNVEGEYEAHLMNLRIEFDKNSFQYLGKKNGDAYNELVEEGAIGTCDITLDGKAVSFAVMMLTDPTSVEGELVKLKFKALSSAGDKTGFKLIVDEFGYMPVGQSNATDIECTASGLSVSVSGGSATTPTEPASSTPPIGKPTPGPDETADPDKTQDPDATQEPGSDVSKVTPDPDATPGADDPGQNENGSKTAKNWIKYLLIALGGLVAAALIALGIFLIARKDRKEN